MIAVGIDIGKFSHTFSMYNSHTGEVLIEPTNISNNKEGFDILYLSLKKYSKTKLIIGMEDTGHYHFNLLRRLLKDEYNVVLINPITTDLHRRMNGGISKNDKLDSIMICEIITSTDKIKKYRIASVKSFKLYEQKLLTRHHHDLKEELSIYTNRLQKCIDIVFPEYNSLSLTKYSSTYMEILKTFSSAANIAKADIRTIRKCFKRKVSLSAERLKEVAKESIGISSISDEIQIKHLIAQIELISLQVEEVDKKIEEFSLANNSPILSIPGISHFSGTSILAELGDINNFSSFKKIIKYSGVAPSEYQSGNFKAEHTSITKKGSKYLRKTLYQVILPIIRFNKVFKDYYYLKRSQGKSHRCACGHCVRKLLRVIYHLLTTNKQFDPLLLR